MYEHCKKDGERTSSKCGAQSRKTAYHQTAFKLCRKTQRAFAVVADAFRLERPHKFYTVHHGVLCYARRNFCRDSKRDGERPCSYTLRIMGGRFSCGRHYFVLCSAHGFSRNRVYHSAKPFDFDGRNARGSAYRLAYQPRKRKSTKSI